MEILENEGHTKPTKERISLETPIWAILGILLLILSAISSEVLPSIGLFIFAVCSGWLLGYSQALWRIKGDLEYFDIDVKQELRVREEIDE